MPRPSSIEERAVHVLRQLGGTARTREILAQGVHPRTLYRLRDEGTVEALGRGVYRLADRPAPAYPDLLIIAARVPRAVVCLTSALSFHELTDQIPHAVHLALPRGSAVPRLDHPPLHVVRMSEPCYGAGVEIHDIDGLPLAIYSPAKSVVDCFKFRNLVGLDTARTALRNLRGRRGFDAETLLGFAKRCRVESVVRPHVEALL